MSLERFLSSVSYLLQASEVEDQILKGHNGPVIDFDLSQTDEVLLPIFLIKDFFWRAFSWVS